MNGERLKVRRKKYELPAARFARKGHRLAPQRAYPPPSHRPVVNVIKPFSLVNNILFFRTRKFKEKYPKTH